MEIKKLALSVGLAVIALGSIGASGVAQATYLQIVTGPGSSPEVTGDAGGTSYPWAGGPGPGAGVPSAAAGWPITPGFATDPSFGNALGTSGFDASYLWLSQSANVTFQFMGSGDSTLANQFWVDGVQIFLDGTTNPIAVNGNPPQYTGTALNQITIPITVAAGGGYIPFYFVTGAGVTSANDGINNAPDTDPLPGYMLGADPYVSHAGSCLQANGESCTAVFAGLADLPRVDESGNIGDHDYQDMGVRVTVPEPGSIFLLGGGLLGLASLRRRKA